MSNLKCKKEIWCWGKAINDLKSNIDQMEFLRNRSIDNFGLLDEKEIEENTKKAEEIIIINKQVTKTLMS